MDETRAHDENNQYKQCLIQYSQEIIINRILRGLSGEIRYERTQKLSQLLNSVYRKHK